MWPFARGAEAGEGACRSRPCRAEDGPLPSMGGHDGKSFSILVSTSRRQPNPCSVVACSFPFRPRADIQDCRIGLRVCLPLFGLFQSLLRLSMGKLERLCRLANIRPLFQKGVFWHFGADTVRKVKPREQWEHAVKQKFAREIRQSVFCNVLRRFGTAAKEPGRKVTRDLPDSRGRYMGPLPRSLCAQTCRKM